MSWQVDSQASPETAESWQRAASQAPALPFGSQGHKVPVAAAMAEGEGQNVAHPRPALMPVLDLREKRFSVFSSQAACVQTPALRLMPALGPGASPLTLLSLHFCMREMGMVPASHPRPVRTSSRHVPVEAASQMQRLHR